MGQTGAGGGRRVHRQTMVRGQPGDWLKQTRKVKDKWRQVKGGESEDGGRGLRGDKQGHKGYKCWKLLNKKGGVAKD